MIFGFDTNKGELCLEAVGAAGVAVMGIEHINFVWYLRHVAPWALLGFASGVIVFFVQQSVAGSMQLY